MIVQMKRLMLLCMAKEVDSTLKSLRDLGAVHLDLQSGGGGVAAAGGELEDAEKAVRIALKAAKETGSGASSGSLSVESILELDARREELKTSAGTLKGIVRKYEPFGDFDPVLAEKLAAAGVASLFLSMHTSHSISTPHVSHFASLFAST